MQVFSPGLVLALKVGALATVAGIIAALFLWRRYIELQPLGLSLTDHLTRHTVLS